MYVCMYTCMYVYMYVYMCMYTCTYVYMYICVYVYMYVYVCMPMYVWVGGRKEHKKERSGNMFVFYFRIYSRSYTSTGTVSLSSRNWGGGGVFVMGIWTMKVTHYNTAINA